MKRSNQFTTFECRALTVASFAIVTLGCQLVSAQEASPQVDINWQSGPSVADLGVAQISIPDGYIFAGPEDTRTIMEMLQNPPSGKETGLIAPADEASTWLVVFEYDNVGYIKDDEKNSLNPDALLTAIKRANDVSNERRAQRGWPRLDIIGWEEQPHYDLLTNNLEWAVRGKSAYELVVNYNTRLLGRGGVMRVTLVSDPTNLQYILPLYKTLLTGFRYKEGSGYAEFRAGDKVAAYGLSALVVGGATAVATKSGFAKGLAKGLWAFILMAFAAVAAAFHRVVYRVKGLLFGQTTDFNKTNE